jgi:hypothetical protein
MGMVDRPSKRGGVASYTGSSAADWTRSGAEVVEFWMDIEE